MSEVEALNKGYPKLFDLGDTEVFVHRLKDDDSEVFGGAIVVLNAIAEFSDPKAEECNTIAQPGSVKEEFFYFWNKCNAILYGYAGQIVHNDGYKGAQPLIVLPHKIQGGKLIIENI
ncbi:hypothetical protein ACJJI4_18765 [Microbulbifer sp. TRSA002]|uniref:hypothetical protein n=1 Tax=Microbulbifer sp. TRSA002 TaxID=3243382 RepID=UPI00403A498B